MTTQGEAWCEKDQRFFNPTEWRLHLSLCNEHPGVWLWAGDWFKANEYEAKPKEGQWWVCRKKIGATSVQFGPFKEFKADELLAELRALERRAEQAEAKLRVAVEGLTRLPCYMCDDCRRLCHVYGQDDVYAQDVTLLSTCCNAGVEGTYVASAVFDMADGAQLEATDPQSSTPGEQA